MTKFDVSLVEEISEQDFDGVANGAVAQKITKRGGRVCTLTKDCQRICW